MSVIRIAKRYARSIVGLAIEKGLLEEVYADMNHILAAIDVSRDLELMLKSPIINADKKHNVLKAIFDGKVSPITSTFIDILIRKTRESHLVDVAKEVIAQYNTHKHITPVKLKSAVELDKATIDGILNKLKTEAGLETIELTTEVDESLLGGFVLQYQDKLYDASLVRGLNIVKSDFAENKYIKELFK